MGECSVVKERMPDLLVESLDSSAREATHQHIERCAACAAEWAETRAVWNQLGELPELPVPARVRANFLTEIGQTQRSASVQKVVAFRPRTMPRWLAQAAAVVILASGAFLLGRNTTGVNRPVAETPALVQSIQPAAFRLAESSVLPASQVNPEIQGHPEIANVRFQEGNDGQSVAVSFDLTSHVTITGRPDDKSLVNLLAYLLQNREYPSHSRSNAIQWVRDTYSANQDTDPEIVRALANVLKNDTHEGVRIKAVEALKALPATLAPEARTALVEALKTDPNPAVRMKAVEALANLAATDATSLDPAAVDALREKAGQEDENLYVRVKAAEALSQIKL